MTITHALIQMLKGLRRKQTAGIKGAATKTQAATGIPDTVDINLADTLKGGA